MTLSPLTSSNKKEFLHLYKEAFPKSERKPFFLMRRRQSQGVMEILCIQEGGRFLGLAITILYQELVLLDYFAISPAARGQGAGSRALALLKERYAKKTLFLEIEYPEASAANYSQRARRKEFYRRNGILPTGVQVMLMGVHMELLCYGGRISFAQYSALLRHALGPVFFRMLRLSLMQQSV